MQGLQGAVPCTGGKATDRAISPSKWAARNCLSALGLIESHCVDSDLSIESLAIALNVSSRPVQRAFLSFNTTP